VSDSESGLIKLTFLLALTVLGPWLDWLDSEIFPNDRRSW
jgi:hypothetical protein